LTEYLDSVMNMPGLHAFAAYTIDILWVIWLTFWLLCAFRNKRTVYRQPWQRYLPFVLIGICGPVVVQFIPHPFRRLLPITMTGDAIGVGLGAAGLGWSIWARVVLGANWSGIVTLKQNHELIQSGPYRITRHPIYTGLITAIAGTFFALTPTGLGAVILTEIAAAFIIKLRQEEKVLLQHFPEAYPAYKTKVKAALIPWIW
jgi:protein-S-isoprenylcysteine O-methyltransferase Ste14